MLILEIGNAITQGSKALIEFVQSNFGMLAVAVILIIVAILVIVFLKQILINSILGVIIWAVLLYFFQVKLNFWISLIASIIFGLAGIGVLLLLKFFGISV